MGSEFQVNATTAGDQLNANIAMNASGKFVVSWSSDDQGVYAQRFNADGTAVGGEFLVNATTADQSYGTIYTVSGAGSDIGGSSDQGQFASPDVAGDITMIAEVDSMTYTEWNAKAGVMFRESTAADSMYAMVFATRIRVSGSNGATAPAMMVRREPVCRRGCPRMAETDPRRERFSAYYSTDGVTWIQVGTTQTMDMNNDFQAGLAVSSMNADACSTAKFSNVTINGTKDFALTSADLGVAGLAGSCLVSDGFQVGSPTVAIDDSGGVSHYLVELRSGCAGKFGRL